MKIWPAVALGGSPVRIFDTMKIVMAKPGLDGHDRGAKVIARSLRDGGHEVVYTGLGRTPEEISRIVMDETQMLLASLPYQELMTF